MYILRKHYQISLFSIRSVAIKHFLHFSISCSLRLLLEAFIKKHQKYWNSIFCTVVFPPQCNVILLFKFSVIALRHRISSSIYIWQKLHKYLKIISMDWTFYLEYLHGKFMIFKQQLKKIGSFQKRLFL